MNNRKSKSEKKKNGFVDESSDDDGSISDENSNLPLNNEDNESLNTSDSSDVEEGISSDSNSDNVQFSKPRRKKHLPANILLSDSSDSSDDTQEKCTICLRSINNQEVGSPEGCDHLFCSICIIEWSKNSNVCPLDRQQFSIILIRKNKNGKVIKQLPVEEPKSFYYHYSDEDDTHCEICGESNREDRMLLCDGCERGFHIECLTPPLEEVPTEDEWFCPSCLPLSSISTRGNYNRTLSELEEELCRIERRHGLRPSISGTLARAHRSRFIIRTQLLERIRRAISKMILKCLTDSDEDNIDTEDADFVTDNAASEDLTTEESVLSENRPGPSGLQRKKKRTSSKKRKTYKKKQTVKKTTLKRKRKRKTQKRKTVKSKTKKRSVTKTKSVKITSTDERMQIFHPLTFKRRRKLKVKKKVKTAATRKRASGAFSTPKTVKGRLALTLGIVPPKKPGQLLPEIKVKPSSSRLSSIDINRARAGIPTLHIFEPRNELVVCNSSSDGEDMMGDENGPVATLVHPRTSISSLRDRKRAALLIQSTTSSLVKSKPICEESPKKEIDFLGSILDSQAIWHSKNTNVKINEDGSIEVLKKAEQIDKNPIEKSRSVDVTGTVSESITTQAPLYPGSGSRPGGFRPNNRASFGEPRGSHENSLSGRGSSNPSGIGFNRFGGAQRNDREGYANYLNNVPQGPTPFCRGGPPLRFRMPTRQQLRRISFPPRTNRSPWPNVEEGENVAKNINKEKQSESKPIENKKADEEELVDLYSDIETNAEKAESSEHEEATGTSYRVLGPPPEPSAFLLGIDENGEVTGEKDKSDVYDPAEPCDSEDETMVIAESDKPVVPEEKERKEAQARSSNTARSLSPSNVKSPKEISCQRGSTEDEDDECPIFSIYSSASREFSQKEEEEREREIAEEKKKLEETKLRDEKSEKEFQAKREGINKGETNESSKAEDEKKDFQKSKVKKSDSEAVATKSKEKSGNKIPAAGSKEDEKCDGKQDQKEDTRLSDATCLKREKSPLDKRATSTSVEAAKTKSLSGRCASAESEKSLKSKTSYGDRNKSCSAEKSPRKKSKRKCKRYESDTESEWKKVASDEEDDEGEKGASAADKMGKTVESENESVHAKIATGLEGLDVEEVSSDNGDGDDFAERRSLSSLSLSELSNRSKASSRVASKKKKKKKRRNVRKAGKKNDDELRVDADKQKLNSNDRDLGKIENENIENEGKYKKKKSKSIESDRQVLGTKENKKDKNKDKERDLSWKKPSKKEKNYREGKKRSRDRGRSRSKEERRSRSKEERRSRSFSPKKDKKKNRERKKKSDKKKDIERYDVRKIVKNKEIRKTDAFGRDILSKSRSISRSRSRSPIRGRSRNMLRRDSRSYSRSRSRSYRRGRSPGRRRYIRSRTKSRSKSIRKSFSRSRSRSIRKSKKKFKSKGRLKERSRSRRKSRSRRRSPSRSRSRSPLPRPPRGKKQKTRRSWSNHSRSLSFSPRRSKSVTRSPVRVRRSYSRSASSSWSGGRTPLPRTASLEKLTVVLKTKDKKKGKKKKEGKKGKRDEERRKKVGNSKEVFASGDNVLVSVNFRNNNNNNSNSNNSSSNNNNNNASSNSNSNNNNNNNNNGSASNEAAVRNARVDSLSPAPSGERKKKRESDYEFERNAKKAKKSSAISKNVVDVALSSSGPKRAKKLTRLNEKDAEVILNRKPVAVIDLDISPYREQTPSPINVVVVSDSGSGDEEKEQTPQRQKMGRSPVSEPEKSQESVVAQSASVSLSASPVANGYLTGPKTPPEPQIKFSIAKPAQLRQIANPLGDDDDEDEEEEEEDEEDEDGEEEEEEDGGEEEEDGEEDGEEAEAEEDEERAEGANRMESLDRRIEKELDASHKGPNTPPEPRGPSTPKTPPSPQSSPDAYDPFEPTKSRSPTPNQMDKKQRQSPCLDAKEDQPPVGDAGGATAAGTASDTMQVDKISSDLTSESNENASSTDVIDKQEAGSDFDCSATVAASSQAGCAPGSDSRAEGSPERKISVAGNAAQAKAQSQKAYAPILKQLSGSGPASGNSSGMTASFGSFSLASPTKSARTNSAPAAQVTGIQRLQHRLGSPVSRTPNSLKSTTPGADFGDAAPAAGAFRAGAKRNGEQAKQMRPLPPQDSAGETVDMTLDMDDSPYSPASSEGDDLFDPPTEPIRMAQQNPKAIQPGYKPPPRAQHKSPVKQLSKFDLLFGSGGPTLSPLKVGNKKPKANSKPGTQPKMSNTKTAKKCTSKRGIALKMDEDQLRILDELPSSAVELQVKDKFLKKLNRQERVVDEVKTVLKPHYARKHITKEEYKDILRRSVPKICHSRSGEINPSKIQSLIEAYVRKFRHAKKRGSSDIASKPKVK